jgi:hypothetical protein
MRDGESWYSHYICLVLSLYLLGTLTIFAWYSLVTLFLLFRYCLNPFEILNHHLFYEIPYDVLTRRDRDTKSNSR